MPAGKGRDWSGNGDLRKDSSAQRSRLLGTPRSRCAKNLSDEQTSAIKQWAEEGLQLADIQKRLMGQFGLNVTYMDTRFLVLDLGIEIQVDAPEAIEEGEVEVVDPGGPTPTIVDPGQTEAPASSVQVGTDEVARPGAVISGTVTFSDGEKAVWMIDQMGRPGLDPDTPGYQPTEGDLDEFEKHLRAILKG